MQISYFSNSFWEEDPSVEAAKALGLSPSSLEIMAGESSTGGGGVDEEVAGFDWLASIEVKAATASGLINTNQSMLKIFLALINVVVV